MIYLLEDNPTIRNFVTYALKNEGFKVKNFDKPSLFWSEMENEVPKLLLLDVMLPEEDGYRILSKLRKNSRTAKLPVIMLTAKSQEYDKVIGFDTGADDYVTKPFSMVELLARIKALLRRSDFTPDKTDYHIGSLYLNPAKHIIKVYGEDITLTFKEFELLSLLCSQIGNVISREDILRKVWGMELDGENRTVDVHIRTLRSKLGVAGELIKTVRGAGYKICEGEEC